MHTNISSGAKLSLLGLLALLLVSGTPSEQIREEPKVQPPQKQYLEASLDKRTTTLLKVYQIGREVGHPETLQAIALQESNGGVAEPVGNKTSPVGKRSYGLMQVQVSAARSILSRHPSLVTQYFNGRSYHSLMDEEIIAVLLKNDEANIRIAALHFNLYLRLSKGDWHRAVAAYNVGIGGVQRIDQPEEYQYVQEIVHKINTVVKPFNTKHKRRLSQQQ